MCGRFTLTARPEAVAQEFSLAAVDPFPARFNIAPTQPILIVRDVEGRGGVFERQSHLARWGLIPSWAKDPATLPLLFNARSETAAERNAFRGAMRYRRCLVPASGFYEWRRKGKARPDPFFLKARQREPIAFAGLAETFLAPDGSEIDTAAILTVASNEALRSIHERMPVVLRRDDFARWLDTRDNAPDAVADLLRTPAEDLFEIVPVSERVNAVANMGPDVQEPVSRKDAPAQGDLF